MNIDMIEAAAQRIEGVARRTPMLTSPFVDEIAGRRVLIKPECLQHTGSFKFRGAYSAVTALDEATRAKGVLAYSSGNHAQGVALAAKMLGAPATIVMPTDAPAIKIANTKAYGADVVLYDRPGGESREVVGAAVQAERGLTLIKPFDEPQVIAGQGTTGLEIAAQAAEHGVTDAEVLVCCGGGGLTAGIALGLEARAPALRVRPVEPEGFDDVTRSLATGTALSNPSVSGSICDAILTPAPGDITFPILQRLCGPGIVVSDAETLRAMAVAFLRLKVVAEPGGAVALAAALYHADKVEGDAVIAVISGGNVDAEVFQRALNA
jgi:threonine dehydratase